MNRIGVDAFVGRQILTLCLRLQINFLLDNNKKLEFLAFFISKNYISSLHIHIDLGH